MRVTISRGGKVVPGELQTETQRKSSVGVTSRLNVQYAGLKLRRSSLVQWNPVKKVECIFFF